MTALRVMPPNGARRCFAGRVHARRRRPDCLGGVRRGQAGFTLIEVLVALTILSISIGVLLAVFLQGLDRARESSNEATARVLAQALIAQAKVAANLSFGTSAGKINGLAWRTQVLPYGTAADRAAWQSNPAQIIATVSWRGDGGQRSLRLSALRLLSKPGASDNE